MIDDFSLPTSDPPDLRSGPGAEGGRDKTVDHCFLLLASGSREVVSLEAVIMSTVYFLLESLAFTGGYILHPSRPPGK